MTDRLGVRVWSGQVWDILGWRPAHRTVEISVSAVSGPGRTVLPLRNTAFAVASSLQQQYQGVMIDRLQSKSRSPGREETVLVRMGALLRRNDLGADRPVGKNDDILDQAVVVELSLPLSKSSSHPFRCTRDQRTAPDLS